MDPLHLPGSGPRRHPRAWSRPRAAATSPWSIGRAAAWSRTTPWRRSPRRCSGACSARRRCWPTCPRAGWASPAQAAAALGEPERWAMIEAIARNDPGEPSPSAGSRRPRRIRAPQAGGAPRRRGASLGRGRAGAARDHALLRRRALRADALRAARLRGRDRERLPHPAGRPGPARRRPDRRDAAQRLRQQGPVDHGATRPSARRPASCAPACARCICGAPAATCSAAPPTICSGSAATASGPRAPCACCAACCRASSRTAGPTATRRCCSACCSCSCSNAAPTTRRSRPSPAGTASRSWSAP